MKLLDKDWNFRLTFGVAQRLKSQGFDILTMHEDNAKEFIGLRQNTEKFVSLLWALLEPQAKEHGISKDLFFDALDGATIQAAWDEFSQAYVDFIPNPETRSGLAAGLKEIKRQEERIGAVIAERTAKLEEIAAKIAAEQMSDEWLEAKIRARLAEQTSSESPGGLPDTSASLPGTSRSANSP